MSTAAEAIPAPPPDRPASPLSGLWVGLSDALVGLGKSVVFGGVLSLICCHRGFHSRPGAEGVGRSATEGFVLSFVAILAIDFVLAMLTSGLTNLLWPPAAAKVA